MFSLWLVKDNYKVNILPMVSSISWSGNVDTLGLQLDFEICYDKYLLSSKNNFVIAIGDTIALLYSDNGKGVQIFRGKVISQVKNKDLMRSFTCFDNAFYLNKSKEVIQFKNITAKQAIEKLLDKYSIPHNICNIGVSIKKIYSDKTVSDIIKDILSIASASNGKKYNLCMKNNKLTIEEYKSRVLDATQLPLYDLSIETSIEEMANRIIVHNSSEKSLTVYAKVEDKASIKKYGLIQHTEKIDKDEKKTASTVAKSLLKQKNVISETGSVKMKGNYKVECGMLLKLYDAKYNINNYYVVTSANHKIDNNSYEMSLGLEVYRGWTG